MGLKRKITKDEYEKLSKDMQKEYWQDGDSYVLDIESGEDDPAELRRARDREKSEAKRLKKELDAANAKLAALEEGGDGDDDPDDNNSGDPPPRRERRRRTRDAATIDQSWRERMEKERNTAADKQEKLRTKIRDREIGSAAQLIATKISTIPKVMAQQIASRLTVEFDDDDEPTLVVLGKNGKPSDLTLDQLEREFVANKEFAAIIIGSKASGGGAPRNGPEQKPGGAGASDSKPSDLSKMSPKDLAAHLKSQKENSEA